METADIQHDAEEKRFFLRQDGLEAELTYAENDDGVMIYNHTYVPDEWRGMGVAGKLAVFALDWAKEKGWKVRPTCSYIVMFLRKHQEYNDILA